MGGKHKWLGGALLKDVFFAVPSHSRYVLRVDPVLEEVSYVEDELPVGKFKWLRAVATNEAIFGIPCCATSVLCISGGRVKMVPISGTDEDLHEQWKWHGAQLSGDECIYAPPANARQVLKVDIHRLEASLLPITTSAEGKDWNFSTGKSKFYGGILDDFGSVWGIPFSAGAVLKACENRATVIDLPEDHDGFEKNHHGGLKCAKTGAIFGFPANSDHIIRIDPGGPLKDDKVTLLPVPGPRSKYQWAGGLQCDATGIIYGLPSDAPDILKIDPFTNHVSRFGQDFFQPYQKNKFQNAILGSDAAFYAIPSDADYVLRIDPLTDTLTRIGEGIIPPGKDKWQGGFAFRDSLWAVPENAEYLLKIDIPSQTVSLVGWTHPPPDSLSTMLPTHEEKNYS